MPKPINRSAALRLTGTLITLALLIYLLYQQGWGAVLLAVQRIPVLVLAFCFLLVVFSRIAVAARWHALLSLPGMQVRFAQTLRITFAGLFATNFLPTTIGGDVVRLAGAIRLKFDPAYSAASLVADRLVGMAGMLMALPLGLPVFLDSLSGGSAGKFGLAGAAGLSQSRRWHSLRKKVRRFIGKTADAFTFYIRQPRALVRAFIATFIHMACTFAVFYILFDSLGTPLPWNVVAGLYSLVYLVTLLPFSINGYGLQEVSIAVIYSRVAGASVENSLTVALLYRTMVMLASLPGAFYLSDIVAGTPQTAEDPPVSGSGSGTDSD